eukprot:CAMPEP_0202691960 /NCGR_PEP_ID=MMETSP1385-20130828/6494_1 /ASSEMBLY_ACC=CAM_ASM_000861 /TAXON_ID=933848 /ORGANISM="Elphidium margaritaceum" /LENGTH=1474 /DNA_ID=CAMNT_0049347425 /DNA_START=27 /DNA_END=4451 /DNA_ORIENTATION=+
MSSAPWWKSAKAIEAESFSDWQELRTEDGLVYYFNRKTQETTWDKPAELMSEEEKAYESNWVWVPDETEVYVAGRIIDDSGAAQVAVEMENGGERMCSRASLISMKQSSLQRIVSDLTLLDEMSIPLILHCLRKRFEGGKIYSAIGTILISINPYTQLDLYTPKMIRKYRNSLEEHREVPPHVFVIADQAYKGLTFASGPNQSIVISGESGAGKTEATKQCLSYLGAVAGSVAGVEKKVFDANPILESFGNAKTVRNNNSSRFGKYVEIYMNQHLQLMGGKTTNYLLEKVRVSRQGESERNYHFFYMLTKGCDRALRKELELKTPDHYAICTEGHCVQVPGINDKNDFEEINQAFRTLQFRETDVHSIFRFVAGILHIGNVQFDVVQSQYADDGSSVSAASGADLAKCGKLWRVDVKKLEAGITHKALVMPGNRTVEKGLNPRDAHDQRASLIKFVYSKLFDWLVIQINKSMEPKAAVYKSIGLLDIFGFEIFQRNSLEQLCINFCNEKLQQLFNFTVFKLEEKVYRDENIGVDHVPFIDNQPILDLIEKKPHGLLPLLDEEGITPGGSEDKYREKLRAQYSGHKYFKRYGKDDLCFVLTHYAGQVVYATDGFMAKNKDILDEGLLLLLDSSKEPIIQTLFSKNKKGGGGGGLSSAKRKMTLSAQFRTQLNKLMQTLHATQPHYIRCIKPNDSKEPLQFVPRACFEQLTYSGVFEAVKIRKGGFPFRLRHTEFADRYRCILEEDNVACGNGKQGCRDICTHLHLNASNIREGRTMLLYRALEHRVLELKRNIIMEKRKMNETLKALIQTNVATLAEPELHFERMARVVRACKRYNIQNALSEKAKKLLNQFIESRIDAQTKNLLEQAIAEKDLDKLERVCAIIEREQYETEKCKLALRMRDRIHVINRESEQAVVTLDTSHMEACLFAATELDYTNDYIDYFRWMFDTLGKDSEKFVQEQMRQAVKMGDLKRQLRLNIKLKDLVFDKLHQSFAIQNCPVLKEDHDWAAEKLFGRDKLRQNMMTWTADEIHSHLTTTLDKKHKKEGRELFKSIQIYMGDRENKHKTQEELGLDIVIRGHQQKEFGDEIYCQLIKQLTNNNRPQSVNRGWNLLNLCLYVFSPSRELENYLEVFIRNQPQERKERSLTALQSILYSASGGMKKTPTLKDMQDILNGIRPVKRDFLENPPEGPSWAPLTVSFYDDKAEDAEEYFDSASEQLAGAHAPQPKLVNNKPLKSKKGKNKAPPQTASPAAAKFNFGQNLGTSNKGPPANPLQQQMLAQQQKAEEERRRKEEAQKRRRQPEAHEEKEKEKKTKLPQPKQQPKQQKKQPASEYKWLCHLDPESGDVFYERISDGVTQWDRPKEAVKPHWLAHLDAESAELYFENIDSGVTQWNKPDEFSDPDEQWIARLDADSGEYYYENVETQKTQWEVPSCFAEKVPDQEWMRHFDPTSGEYYYENVRNGQTTWDPPAGVNFQ